jgi:hypothetical protein
MSLSEEQRLMLQLWGYPYVRDEFRFHMTLTDKFTQLQIDKCRPLLESYLQPYTSRILTIDQISLCYQAIEHSPFVVMEAYPLKVKKKEN